MSSPMNRALGLGLVFGLGVVFSIGLALGGMTQADKVIGFLSVFDAWDPSLAFVMGGAVLTHLATWRLVTGRPHPLFTLEYAIPTRVDVDARLMTGAALFGLGWGLGGYCPGPGITSAATGAAGPVLFVAMMLVGMVVYDRVIQPWVGTDLADQEAEPSLQ